MKAPRPTQPFSVERQYQRFLVKYASAYSDLVRKHLREIVPVLRDVTALETPQTITRTRTDVNIEEQIRKALELAMAQLEVLFPNSVLRKWALAMIGATNRLAKKNMGKALKAGYKKSKDIPDFEPLMRDGALTPYFQNIVDENIGLIKSIPNHKQAIFKNDLVRLITEDANKKTIEEAITKYVNPLKGNARTVAVDQVGKLNGKLDEYRQRQLGGKRYIWRTAKDIAVAGNPNGLYPHAKPSHWHREGKIFYWAKPPKGGHPKQRVRCRCWAEMVMEDVIE